MTRVSENSSTAALKYAMGKAKSKLEDLQLKGTSLKRMVKPSDDPISNVEALQIRSKTADNKQFLRNSDYGLLQLEATERSLEALTDLLVKAKEIAITQSSDFYNDDIRKNVSNEIIQIRNQALAIANKRIGNRYIFGGYSTLKQPFDIDGNYAGDKGKINLEISKDFFVPINLHGDEVFFALDETKDSRAHPLNNFPEMKNVPKEKIQQQEEELPSRDLASTEPEFKQRENIFTQLTGLITGLENDDTSTIQNLLERFDESISRLITLRTKVGSITNSIRTTQNQILDDNLGFETRKSKLVDADVAELFSDLQKQQAVLKLAYESGAKTMNNKLLDFLR